MENNSVEYYGTFYLGALLAVNKILDLINEEDFKRMEKPYREAIFKLISKDKRSVQLFMDGIYQICFRNHVKDKKNKVKSCEAYFADRRLILKEIK